MSYTSVAALPPSRARRWNNSSLAKHADSLHSQLQSYVNRDKQASIGGEPEQAFEQSFASLAYNFIKDQAPRLIDYLVGFQLVERNNDNTKAVGVFGFKLGNAWAYAPVFFLNGDLKGHELLYLKDQDMFIPLTEAWVNYIISKRPHVLGNPASNKPRDLGIRYPDYRSLTEAPMYGKRSSCIVYPGVPTAGWLPPSDGFKGVYAAITQDSLEDASLSTLQKHAGFKAETVLHDFISRRPDWCKLAMDVCDAYPLVGEAMERFHGNEVFQTALHKMQAEFSKSAALSEDMGRTVYNHHFVDRRPAKKRRRRVLGEESTPGASPVLGKKASGPSVEIVVKQDALTTENGPDLKNLSDEEAAGVARNGYLVKDQRTGEEVSIAYNTQVPFTLGNPDGPGLYEVLEKPASFVKALVIHQPHSPTGRKNFVVVVRLEPRNWINAHPTAVFAKPLTSTREDFQKWYDGLSSSDSLAVGGTYVLIDRQGTGTTPFEVREELGEGRYRIHARDYTSRDRPNYLPSVIGSRHVPSYDDCSSYGPEMLRISDRAGVTFQSASNTLHAPADHKVLRLKSPREESDDCCSDQARSSEPPFELGNLLDVQMEILEKTAALKIYADSCEASINGGPRTTKLAALKSLVLEHGLRARDAEAAIKQAEVAGVRGSCGRLQIMYGPGYPRTKSAADPFLAGQGAQAPAMMEPGYDYSNEWGSQAPTMSPDQYGLPVEEMSSYNTQPDAYDVRPEAMPDPYAMQTAQQAGQSGQKEVFDTAMIGNLLKSVRQDPMISRYIPDLLKSLDRCGRLLALFYWHNEKFLDRYGKSDGPELEDTLRNTFEATGELVLFLKAKDVAPLSGTVDADIDVDDATGD